MHVFEIIFPGTFLDYPDGEWRGRIHRILHLLEMQFTDAVIALNLFEGEQRRLIGQLQGELQKEGLQQLEEQQLRQKLEQKFLEELGEQRFFQMYPAILHAIEVEMRRERLESGEMPHEYQSRIAFMYAHAYVYALDSFEKILHRLAEEPNVPPGIFEPLNRFRDAFPHLKGVRDSAHHIEDRGLGRDRYGRPLNLKPIDDGIIHAPAGGVLVLSVLKGNKLQYTSAEGGVSEIGVKRDNMAVVAAIFQEVINAFRWSGRPRHILS